MKAYILLFSLLAVSCGKKTITKHVENPFDNSANDDRLTALENRMQQIENDFLDVEHSLSEIALKLSQLDQESLYQAGDIQALEGEVNSLQASLNALQVRLTSLDTGENIVKHLDPCGDMPGQYDEILLVTASGKVVAYFEVGNKRFLSTLEPGVLYQTTDNQACQFRVNALGELI